MPIIRASAVTLSMLLYAGSAFAVCFYPGTERSGYRVPLNAEIASSSAIVEARVVAYTPGPADGSDVSVSIEVRSLLKGSLRGTVTFLTSNDSGGFRASVGETYLIFFAGPGNGLSVDACGNTVQLPSGKSTLAAVRRRLHT